MATKKTSIAAPTDRIKAPNMGITAITIRGNAPYVSNKFSSEAKEMMRAKQAAGHQATVGRKREPKDFDAAYRESMHKCATWIEEKPQQADAPQHYGAPASSFRQAMVSACRLVGFKMTMAKLGLFVLPDAHDKEEQPLVVFTKGTPSPFEAATRNETGVADIRARGRWSIGWEMTVRVRYDADLFQASDVRNLMMRVGHQIGIGAGRPDSKDSCGQDWGTFDVIAQDGTQFE